MCRLHLLGNFNIRRFTSVSLASHFQTDLLKSNVARLLATVSSSALQRVKDCRAVLFQHCIHSL